MERVRQAVEYWMELLGADSSRTIDALRDATERYQLTKNGRPYCAALRPCFIEPAQCATVARAAERLMAALGTLVARLLADQTFRYSAGFPAYLDAVLDIDRGASRPSIMARLDGMLDREGTLRFIEYNAAPDLLHNQFETDRIFERAPIGRTFAQRMPFHVIDVRDFFVDALNRNMIERGRPLPARLVVLTTKSSTITHGNTQWATYAASRGCRVWFQPLARLDVREDGVFIDDERIDVVAFDPNMLVMGGDTLRPLLDAVRRGLVETLFGVSHAILSSNKLAWELLSDPAYADTFDHDTQRVLREHIPWTRRVRDCKTQFKNQRIDLLSFASQHREQFVLKPGGSARGEGVVLGWTCDKARWQATLEQASRRPFVLQERVPTIAEQFPMLVDGKLVMETRTADLNPFVWNGTHADGFAVRVGRDLHNVAGGASMAPLFVLD